MKAKHTVNVATWRYGAASEILRGWVVGAVAIGVILLLAGGLFGGVKGEGEVIVPVNRLASVPLEIDADESEYKVVGMDIDAFREYDPDPKKLRLRVIGYKDTTAWVVVSSVKGGKLQPMFMVRVTVGNGSPDPKPPAPIPPAPVPDDPELLTWATAIKTAATKDAYPASKLLACAAGFRACAELAKRGGTASAMRSAANIEMAKALKNEDVPANTYEVLAARLNSSLPQASGAPIDSTSVAAFFNKLAAACERAAK